MPEYTLDYWEPYITGKQFTPSSKETVRLDESVLKLFSEMVEGDPVAKPIFEKCDIANEFYETMVDFKHWIPKEQRAEVFYAYKNGEYNINVPSLCVFTLKRAWEKCYGIPNLITKVLPNQTLTIMCSKGYLGEGVCLRDVICSTCTNEYTPLSNMHPKNKLSKGTEIYILSTDMVAVVPDDVASQLSDEAIRCIEYTPKGLMLGKRLLRTMGGHYGIINSVYDLRELV